jgi:hypothetical protein
VDALEKQQYRIHLVMNSSRHGREPIMSIVPLPISCSLRTLALARNLTPERKTSILTNTSLAIEGGMNLATGKYYRSVIFLQDELTRAET